MDNEGTFVYILKDDAVWSADALQHIVDTRQLASLQRVVAESIIERIRKAVEDLDRNEKVNNG